VTVTDRKRKAAEDVARVVRAGGARRDGEARHRRERLFKRGRFRARGHERRQTQRRPAVARVPRVHVHTSHVGLSSTSPARVAANASREAVPGEAPVEFGRIRDGQGSRVFSNPRRFFVGREKATRTPKSAAALFTAWCDSGATSLSAPPETCSKNAASHRRATSALGSETRADQPRASLDGLDGSIRVSTRRLPRGGLAVGGRGSSTRGDGERRGARGAARGERERDARARAVRIRRAEARHHERGLAQVRGARREGWLFFCPSPRRRGPRGVPRGRARWALHSDVDAHELQRHVQPAATASPPQSERDVHSPVRNVGVGVPRARSAEVRHELEITRRPHRPTGCGARIRPTHRPGHRSHRAATPARVESRGGRGGTRVFGRPQLQRRRPTRKGHCRRQSGVSERPP